MTIKLKNITKNTLTRHPKMFLTMLSIILANTRHTIKSRYLMTINLKISQQ